MIRRWRYLGSVCFFHLSKTRVSDFQINATSLQIVYYNNIVVRMIPELVPLPGSPWPVLPPGIHMADLNDVSAVFATVAAARTVDGLVDASGRLRRAGCPTVYLDGSFI